jgi:phosphate:Na+ symporter
MSNAALGWPVIAKLLGGVGLFLLGMTLLTEGLKALAGPRLRRTLQRVTADPVQGFVAGTAMTVLTQASSATVLATVGFVTARLLPLALAIPLVVGATVGTSSTTWIVATLGMSPGIVSVLMPLLAIGALMRALGRGTVRPVGTALAGLAVLLLSIGFIRETVGPVAMALDLSSTTADGLGGAAWLLAIGTLLAVAMQSSAAPIAIAMLALAGGALGWTEAAIVTVGATVGTTSTGIVATLGARPAARRVALAWTVTAAVQAAVALAAFPLFRAAAMGLADPIADLTHVDRRTVAIALFHTGFTLTGAAIVLAAPGWLGRILARLVPDPPGRAPALQLDRSALEVPGVAAATARRGIVDAGAAVTAAAVAAIERSPAARVSELLDDAVADLAEVRDFLGAIQVPEGDAGTVRMQRDSVAALDHLTRLVGDIEHLRPALEGQVALRPRVTQTTAEARDALQAFGAWLADTARPVPTEPLRAASRAIGARRKLDRAETLASTATGTVTPEDALAELEALRQLDRMVHHAAKAAGYLGARTNGTAGHVAGEAGADDGPGATAAEDATDEPT